MITRRCYRKKNNKNRYKKISRAKKIILLIIKITIILGLIGSFFMSIVFFNRLFKLPDIDYQQFKNSVNSIVMDKDNKEVGNLADSSMIMIENYSELSQSLIDAFIATEDSRFLIHNGVDGPRTTKAILSTYIMKSGESGGSTITQQLVKQTILNKRILEDSNYKYSEKRKIDEWIASFLLEKNVSKQEILIAYLNNAVSYGRNTGVATAAKKFFNKKVSELTIPESALLAGIPQLPRKNNPYYDISSASQRYKEVLYLMKLHKFITQEQFESYVNIPLSDLLVVDIEEEDKPYTGYFRAIEDELTDILGSEYQKGNHGSPFYYKNYRIYTCLDQEKQIFADTLMSTNKYLNWDAAVENVYGSDYTKKQNNNFQGAFTVVETTNGEIPAIGIARDIRSVGINFAFHAFRSPGSAIKPIIDFIPLIQKFKWGAKHEIYDKTTYYTNSNVEVNNYNKSKHIGKTNISESLADSINTTAVQALQITGIEYAAKIASELGITKFDELIKSSRLDESCALGGGIETTTKQLAGSYAAIANNGKYNKPHIIRKIENISTGDIVWEFDKQNSPLKVLDSAVCSTITDALIYSRHYGTWSSGVRKQVNKSISFAAKTGTSSYSQEEIDNLGVNTNSERDHWHVGYTPKYAIAVWTGLVEEDKDTLTLTKGNSPENKGCGSYILSSWINRFDTKEKFNFTDDSYTSKNVGIGEFNVKHNNKTGILTWSEPKIYYPNGIFNSEKSRYNNLKYHINFVIDGKVYKFDTKERKISYPQFNFNDGIVTITAYVNDEYGNHLLSSNIQTIDKLKYTLN